MRLAILDRGHGVLAKILFGVIRVFSGHPVLDVIKLGKYRPDFYGDPMQRITHEAMRGASAWSVGDRELMAAVIATANRCVWCTRAHCAVARGAYRDANKVAAAVEDLEKAPLDEPLRATLKMLKKLVTERGVDESDMRAVLAAGASREQIEDALAVAFSFNVVNRLADAFEFAEPGDAAFEAGAKYLLARGYR
jgi:uncharacterized peroxidase-related enzyme